MSSIINSTPKEWRAELERLPSLSETGGKIPSIFLAHGQPLLIYPDSIDVSSSKMASVVPVQGPKGELASFLRDLGPALVDKYQPKAIVVFSAHWESVGTTLVTNYGDGNPLLMDFYGFPKEIYETEFHSRGDAVLSARVVELLLQAKIPARTTNKSETRGRDGRGYEAPGLDHGVFVPFKLMLGDKTDIPIVQVSISSSLSPLDEWTLGAALAPLRSEGVLIISGGLTIHTFDDFAAFSPDTAKPVYKEFEKSIIDAVAVTPAVARKEALLDLINYPGFRLSHPREEHFVPLYIAGGASGLDGTARVLSGSHGAKTVVFGV